MLLCIFFSNIVLTLEIYSSIVVFCDPTKKVTQQLFYLLKICYLFSCPIIRTLAENNFSKHVDDFRKKFNCFIFVKILYNKAMSSTKQLTEILEDPKFWEDIEDVDVAIIPPEPDELTDTDNF